jgi:hypothetical protein
LTMSSALDSSLIKLFTKIWTSPFPQEENSFHFHHG